VFVKAFFEWDYGRTDVEMLEGGRKGVDVEDGGFGLNEGKVERVVSGRECAGFYVW